MGITFLSILMMSYLHIIKRRMSTKQHTQPQQRTKQKKQVTKKEPVQHQATSDVGRIVADSPEMLLANLDRMDPRYQRAAIAQFGRTHGNRAVQRLLLQRKQDDTLQRRDEKEQDPLDRIREILTYTWVAEWDEWELERLWNSFGLNLPEVAAANWDLWTQSYDRGAELDNISWVQAHKSIFADDVKSVIKNYLDMNEKQVVEEMNAIGVDPGACLIPTDEHINEIRKLQTVANNIIGLQGTLEQLRSLPVGYDIVASYGGVGYPTAKFNPADKPFKGPDGDEEPAWPTWDEVNTQYQTVQVAIMQFIDAFPALYGLVSSDDLEGFANIQDTMEAQTMVGGRLEEVYDNIQSTRPKIDNGDLDYRDVTPIHNQLFGGQVKGDSNTDWSKDFYKWIGQDVLSDHESAEFWTAIGLGTAAAAAFVVATLASGGTAAVAFAVGVGLGATQAGMSWEKYLDLAQAADTGLNRQTELVTDGQVNAALFAAVLDTVFVFLDAFGPLIGAAIKPTAKVAQQGIKQAGMAGLEAVGDLAVAESKPLIERAVLELGVEETVKRTGQSADELIEIVGRESDIGQRLTAFKEVAESGLQESGDLAARLPKLGDEIAAGLTRAEADKLVVQAIEQYGAIDTIKMIGGWKNAGKLLGEGSEAGLRLDAWRSMLENDMKGFVADELGGELKRTGTLGKFTSDMDVTLIGSKAAENKEELLSYLSGRTGTPRDQLHNLLDLDVFTDPRRMHIYDELPEAARAEIAKEAADKERILMYSRRLHDAVEEGHLGLAEQIREQMAELGIKEVPYRPLSEADQLALARQIDTLHQQLDEAIKVGDSGLQKELTLEIAEKQALLETAGGGGYWSGGGVRKFVTERDGFGGFTPEELASKPLLPAQRLTAVVDQLPKLDHAVNDLIDAVGLLETDPAKLTSILKAVGKYGDRFTSIAKGGVDEGFEHFTKFNELAEQFETLIKEARMDFDKPGSLYQQLAGETDEVVQAAQQGVKELEGIQTDLLRRLQKQAELQGSQDALDLVQELTIMSVKYMRFRDDFALQALSVSRVVRSQFAAETGEVLSDDSM